MPWKVKKTTKSDSQEDAPTTPPENIGIIGNCLVCLPVACVAAMGVTPNMSDKGDEATKCENDPKLVALMTKVQARWRGAIVRWTSSLKSVLGALSYQTSAFKGTVLFMHGSGGMTYNNVRYARKLAVAGYIVIAPDSMAGCAFRNRAVGGLIGPEEPTPYWGDLTNMIYTSGPVGEYTYSTDAQEVVRDPDKWRALYENVFRLRSCEMHWILGRLPRQMKVGGVFMMGQSEGAMAVARFDDRRYGSMIRGRIISAFSVEYNYFTPTPEAGEFGGNLDVPTLNIIGSEDQYFAAQGSVAAEVASHKGRGGYGEENLTGNAFKTMCTQKLQRGMACVLEGANHDPSGTHDNLLRDLLRAFLASPGDCHRIVDRFGPDLYLAATVKVVQTDSTCDGIRQLVHVGKGAFPPDIAYPKELLQREIWRGYEKLAAQTTEEAAPTEGKQ